MIGTLLHNRYRIESELGKGGMGVVYRAQDTLLNRSVAVKLLSRGEVNEANQTRMFMEARAAAKLNHPNIVSLYDAGIEQEIPFLVMELIHGETLSERKPASLQEILEVVRQVCEALQHAHENGIIHRDLKPDNIVLTSQHGIKLMDFGLAHTVDSPSFTEEGTIIGTFIYLAPELLMGGQPSPQSDIYALGLVIYELVTGRHPFTSENLMAIISQHLHAPVVPPSTYNPSIPPALDSLILSMLSKSPEGRPASAKEVQRQLEPLLGRDTISEANLEMTRGLSILDRIASGRLIGREREVREIKALWNRALDGEGYTLLISGEPGIGKTRLAHETITLAEISKGLALLTECYAEGNPPYWPIARIVLELIVTKRVLPESLPSNVLSDLASISMQLRDVLPNTSPNPPLDAKAEQQRLFESLIAFFAVLTKEQTVLLVVDDAHWADSGTLSFLRTLARRIRRMRLLIVLTYREIELDKSQLMNEILSDLNRERLAIRIKLGRLTVDETRLMIAVMFSKETGSIADEFIQNIYQETEGNPFFLEEVCKALVEDGKIYLEGGEWRRTTMDKISIPQSIRMAILNRLGRLPLEVQDALRMAAVLGREFEYELLHKASEMEEEALINALETAENAHLIFEISGKKENDPRIGKTGSVTFVFAHALIPSTLREGLSGLRRQRMHRRAALALEALYPYQYESLAYHHAMAGDEERALACYCQAAYRAKNLYANADAIHFFTEAFSLLPADSPQRFELLSARACVYELTAQREEQMADIRSLLKLAETEANPARQIDVLVMEGEFFLESEPLQARRLAERALELALVLEDRFRQGLSLRLLGRSAAELFDRVHSREALEESVRCFREAGQPGEAARSLSFLSLVLWNYGQPEEQRSVIEEAIRLSRAAQDKRQEAVNLRRLSTVLFQQKNFTEAQRTAEDSLKLTRAIGDRANEGHCLNALGLVLSGDQQLDQAEQCYRLAIEIAEEIGSGVGIFNAVFNLVWNVYYVQGRHEEGLKFFDQHIDLGLKTNDWFLVRSLKNTKSVLLMILGQYEQALEIRLAELPVTQRISSRSALAADLAFIGRLQAELGQFDLARTNLEQALAHGEENAQPLEIIDALYGLVWMSSLERGEAGLQDTLPLTERVKEILLNSNFPDWKMAFCSLAAQQHLAKGELEKAFDCNQMALDILDTHQEVTTHQEFALLTAYLIFKAAGEMQKAHNYLQQGYDWVIRVAGNIQSKDLRKSWMERVKVNRMIVDAWEKGLSE